MEHTRRFRKVGRVGGDVYSHLGRWKGEGSEQMTDMGLNAHINEHMITKCKGGGWKKRKKNIYNEAVIHDEFKTSSTLHRSFGLTCSRRPSSVCDSAER